MCALIVDALRDAGLKQFGLRIGDLGLFNALLDALDMPERWRRRLSTSSGGRSAFAPSRRLRRDGRSPTCRAR